MTIERRAPAPGKAPTLKAGKASPKPDLKRKKGKPSHFKAAGKKPRAKLKKGGGAPSFSVTFSRLPKLSDLRRVRRPAEPQRGPKTAPPSEQLLNPSPDHFEELRRQWLANAKYVLLAGGHQSAPDVVAAIKRNEAIEALWEHWRELEGFRWPSTDAPFSERGLSHDNWEEVGMLSYLGYHVGKSSKLSIPQRQLLLEMIFRSHLPPLNSLAYMQEWGAPKSAVRLKKMADSIASHTRSRKRLLGNRFAVAIQDWEGDLRYLKAKFYDGQFDWPRT